MPVIRPFEDKHPEIDDSAWLDNGCVIIGDVRIGKNSSIWPNVVARGDIERITIGEASNIQDSSVLHVSHDSMYMPDGAPLVIGDGVTVGHKVMLHGCTIGNYCLIGMGSIVLDRAVVNDHVIVGAGSVVSGGKELESGYLYLGSPARRVRELTEQEYQYLEYSAEHYVRLAERHRKSLADNAL